MLAKQSGQSLPLVGPLLRDSLGCTLARCYEAKRDWALKRIARGTLIAGRKWPDSRSSGPRANPGAENKKQRRQERLARRLANFTSTASTPTRGEEWGRLLRATTSSQTLRHRNRQISLRESSHVSFRPILPLTAEHTVRRGSQPISGFGLATTRMGFRELANPSRRKAGSAGR